MSDEKQKQLHEAAPRVVAASKKCPACGLVVDTTVAVCPQDGTSLVSAAENEPEFRGRYEFLGAIGSGGMGVIYKARQIALNKLVAIKMLHPHIVGTEAFRRFQIEGKAVSLLQHPYIINVYDLAITQSGQPYMVMDFVEGRTLADVIEQDGPLSMDRFLFLFEQICDALAHAHHRGVLHRDIKPSNIMLTSREGREEVRIMDFGIAKLIDESASSVSNQLTRTGETIGSPQYMSPEQARGAKTDIRSDLYSLGCVMYEALTGAPPFSGTAPLEMMMMHLNDKPLSMSQSLLGQTKFSADLEAMIARLLEKNPDLRYQSMEELKSALGRLQSGKSLDRFTDTERRINWQTVSIILVGACLCAAFAVVALYFSKKSDPSPEVRLADLPQTQKEKEKEKGKETALSMIKGMVKEQDRILNLSPLAGFYDVNNKDIAPLENATNADEIDMVGAHVDDRGLEHIGQLKLEKLNLTATDVKDLHALKTMTTLKNLDLERTALNEKGMKVIAHLPNLRLLNLTKTGISDKDLEYLTGLKNLRYLRVRECSHLTEKALQRLKSKLDACSFESSFLTFSENTMPPPESNSLEGQANALQKSKQFPEAAAKFAEAVTELRKASHPNYELMAECLKSRGQCLFARAVGLLPVNNKEAQQVGKEAAKSFEQAGEMLEKVKTKDAAGAREKRRKLREIYGQQALLLEGTRDVRGALAVREKTMKLVDDESRDNPGVIDNLARLGNDWVALKHDEKAEPLLKEAISRYETVGMADTMDCSLPMNVLGDVYLRRQRWHEALPIYEKTITIMKKNPDVWKNNATDGLRWTTAFTYEHLGRNAEAEPLLKELLEHQPDLQVAYQLLIKVLNAEHKQDQARDYANKLQALTDRLKAHK